MHICIETARGGICAGTLRFWWQYSVRNTSRKQLEKVVIQFYCSCSEFSLTCILSSYNLILLKNRISMSPTLVNWFWGPVTFKIILAISFPKNGYFCFQSSAGQLSFRQFELGNDFGGLQLDSFFIVEMLSWSIFHLILTGLKQYITQKIISEYFRDVSWKRYHQHPSSTLILEFCNVWAWFWWKKESRRNDFGGPELLEYLFPLDHFWRIDGDWDMFGVMWEWFLGYSTAIPLHKSRHARW